MATISAALAIALREHQAGRLDAAEQIYRQILAVEPRHADALHLLGVVAHQRGQHAAAIDYIGRAIAVGGDAVAYHTNLGSAYQAWGKYAEAEACHRRALELDPALAEAHNNLGNALIHQGKHEEAAAVLRRALECKPDCAEAHNNLGNVWKDQGNLDEAVACYRRAAQARPDFATALSNLINTLYYCPAYDAAAIYEEQRRWNRRYAQPLAKFIRPHDNDRSPDRRLRVGYVSPDFRRHPVGRFMLPLLESHDHAGFEIFCYASPQVPDAITARCRAAADVWRPMLGRSDEEVAETVRQDRIDILVDLTMHLANHRLLVFARKPAPVQVTYLAYCGTTGLETIDYRLTDPYLDPPGGDERFYSEESFRLPETYWCYRPEEEAPPEGLLPALAAGHVTFGCLNNFCKVTEPTLAAWSRLLQALPRSRLLLHTHAGSHRDRVREYLLGQGIAPERLTLVELLPAVKYLRIYRQIDVALDPFPYGGGTTTCDALWMGVPVVSLAGPMAVGRGGLSILSNLGLAELVARDDQQYVRIAAELAGDLPRLEGLRATLRARMRGSPLMDAPRFAGNVENAYRSMWRRWCGK
jgi:predicted O-linked N-acetylglucosamine transferase (SPINDLY family)